MSLPFGSDTNYEPMSLPLFYRDQQYGPEERGTEKEGIPNDRQSILADDHYYGDKISLFSDDLTLDWKEEVGNNAAVDAEIGRLARRLIRHRDSSTLGTENKWRNRPLIDTNEDPSLDPYSNRFDPRRWMKALLGSHTDKSLHSDPRIASVALRNLHVYSTPKKLGQQCTVGSFPVQIFSMVREFLHSNKEDVRILHNFDGLVKEGEMLLVLGGSGR
jgi:hypothetical protein